jgi:hypothetical protein
MQIRLFLLPGATLWLRLSQRPKALPVVVKLSKHWNMRRKLLTSNKQAHGASQVLAFYQQHGVASESQNTTIMRRNADAETCKGIRVSQHHGKQPIQSQPTRTPPPHTHTHAPTSSACHAVDCGICGHPQPGQPRSPCCPHPTRFY